ncbi:transketolase [Sphingomonas sp. SORGH_AS 950]|uniref:transketolase family protein n=1 Tax=Sphingomonas sp. SORGH_AS_0950 TaxID=3041792 RepID=UPI00277EFF38|nr:transketolase C-terminal domain-containing protein [Sphingomonas sp. SORGH_AS_0950]MDQ1159509.1 transketolase [Sphingomonas sp. SORGH_AS_0950]
MKLADHLGDLLCDYAVDDDALFVLDGDLADSDGAYRFAARFPDRFLMAGIAEQNLVGVAAGLASTGSKPWAFSFAAFLAYRAYDQIRIGLAQSHQAVVLAGSHAGGLPGRNGKSHAAPNDLALMLTLPHLHVFAPADRLDLEWVTDTLVREPHGAYVRLFRADADALSALPGAARGAAGPVRVIAAPAPCTIVSTGLATHWCAALVQALAAEGRQVGLIHLPRLKPLPDLSPWLAGVRSIVVIEDHVTFGGLGSLLQAQAYGPAVHLWGWPVEFAGASGADDDLRRAHALDHDSLMSRLRDLMDDEDEAPC